MRIPYVPLKFKSDDEKMAEFVSHATFLKSDLGPCVTIEYPLQQDFYTDDWSLSSKIVFFFDRKWPWTVQYVTYRMSLKK